MSVEILATGPELIRQGIRGTEPVVEEMIQSAKKEIQVIAYVFTYNAMRVLDLLDQAARKGVKVAVTVNNLKEQESRVRTKLENLAVVASVFDFDDPHGKQLHAKIVIADRTRAVVGSANFTWGGMFGNYEIGLLIEGEAVWNLSRVADALSRLATPVQHTD